MKLQKHDWSLIAGLIFMFAGLLSWSYQRFEFVSFVSLGWLLGLGTSLAGVWLFDQNRHKVDDNGQDRNN